MRKRPTVYVDPSSRILYSAYYLKGLYDYFGRRNVIFSRKPFSGLERKKESNAFDHYMAFVIDSEGQRKKIILDFRDKPTVKEAAWAWCDVYMKINFNRELTDKKYHSKIIAIGPGFGIRIWGLWETFWYGLSNYVRCGFSPLVPLKDHIKDYYGQTIRPWLHEYLSPLPSGEGRLSGGSSVFFIARIWPKSVVDQTNGYRKAFIESCRNSSCSFEGGFFTSGGEPCDQEFEALLTTRSYTTADFLNKNKASAFVFNTPAVFNCHGWKLGEFLAMGKAIISTPLSNELPEELVHGKNIHFVGDEEELKAAVHLLLKNEAYRKKLGTEAQAYFYRQINPLAVISNLMRHCNKK